MSPRQERAFINVLVFVVAGALVFIGFTKGWRINQIPAEYLGYFVAFLGLLSVAGVNLWFHGPLDPKNDQKRAEAGKGHS